ncbi:class I SAM-dependent methyltransferase [Winogradskyella litorisediminis]|uniref:Class I SAM-dependent methyltransferase n=1 Tax=Winogradskyella litorisediminis TaxID=1156618 RepID=A0ABW3N9C6_9FLAO
MNQFLDIELNHSNLDTYNVRNSIHKAIEQFLIDFKGNMLDVGCGKMPYRDFILSNSEVEVYTGLDIETAIIYDDKIKPDFFWDGKEMPFEDNKFDCAICTEVLEHCFEPELLLNEAFRVLKPGGTFFFTVPFLWSLHETPFDAYRYTPFALEHHFGNTGFNIKQINALGGWHASMAQMLGLWIRRSPMSLNKRKFFSFLGRPLIKILLKMDKKQAVVFKEGQMITGVYGIVKKPEF